MKSALSQNEVAVAFVGVGTAFGGNINSSVSVSHISVDSLLADV